MKIAVIGLGRMGEAIAFRAVNAGHTVFGFDLNKNMCIAAEKIGVRIVSSIQDFAHHDVRIFWLMVPQGEFVDKVIDQIRLFARAGDIIIDGGNSKFTHSMRRADSLLLDNIFFLDCGTSGGIHGREKGFCLMVGGQKEAYEKVSEVLHSVAMHDGCSYVGPSGAGHYVKMVHNGIEYGILQAYAEGFHVLKEGEFQKEKLNLEAIARLWNHGSVVRSWILELLQEAMNEDQELDTIAGNIAATGMGKWTVEQAHKSAIPVPTIQAALQVRSWSEETGGNYATKLVAVLRNKFGGHTITKKIKEVL